MNLREARHELRASIMAGNAVIMQSGSGIGKSQLAIQEFGRLKAEGAKKGESWGFGTIFAATQTPPDLIGFQFKGEREYEGKKVTITDPSVPLWMLSRPHGDDEGFKPAWLYDKYFLLIDEYGQGEADVKRAVAEIFLNGGTSPWYLPPGSVRVACTNKGSRYGVTKDFDFCIARRTLINVTGDVEVWLSDFADKKYVHQGREWLTMPVTKAWAATHPEILFEAEPKEQGPWCNPRSLCDADRYLQVKTDLNNGVTPTDALTIESVAGRIGMPATQSLIGHIQFRTELPSYADVVADPSNAPVPKKADLLLLMAYEMAGYTKVEDLAECITYIQRLPKDMAVTYVSAILRRDYANIINTPPMEAWVAKNASLVAIIQSLSA
jgi:hypothetical protein